MNAQFKKPMEAIGAKTQVCFRVVFADGSSWQNRERAPDATIIIRNGRAAWRVLLFGHVGFLDTYANGEMDFVGNIAKAFGPVKGDCCVDQTSFPDPENHRMAGGVSHKKRRLPERGMTT